MKLTYKICVLLSLVVFASCENDEFQKGLSTANMAQMYDSNGDISRSAYKKANTDNALEEQLSDDQLTGFLPSDAAFKNAGFITREATEDGDEEALKEIFLYHVVQGALKKNDLSSGTLSTLSSGKNITVAVGSTVTVSGIGNQGQIAKIVGTDAPVKNGYVHTIDRLLLPSPRTVVDVVEESGVFNLLNAALVRANLKATLSGAGPFTIFAPTDAAFIALLEIETSGKSRATLETEAKALINAMDVDALSDLLKYHVLNGNFSSQALVAGNATTLNGATISIEKDDSGNLKTVTGLANEDDDGDVLASSPLQTDVLVTNGYVQIIDRVLLPE